MAVPFTQYLRPDGRKHPISIELDEVTEAKAQLILSEGLVFECEVLTTNMVSLTITSQERDEDIRLAPNGPKVPTKVAELINEFDLDAYRSRNRIRPAAQ